jgi:hypothetical protein
MAELTIIAGQLEALSTTLSELESLTPPPAPKGRYVLAKIGTRVTTEYEIFKTSFKKFLDEMVTTDEEGKPKYDAGLTPDLVTFTIKPDKIVEYTEGLAAMLSESVVLTGTRAVTHAELGACPITIGQEKVLIACGILIDEEPI